MPALSAKTKHYYRERVRSVLVQNPMISGEGIRRHLERDGLVLDRHYINKLVQEIHTQRIKRAETWTLNVALASFQDAMQEIARVGWEIANDKMSDGRDRAAGLREVREAYNDMFEKLFDAGVFERKLGTLDTVIRNTPLPEERKQAIRAGFSNWGLLGAPKDGVKPLDQIEVHEAINALVLDGPPKEDAGTSTTNPS
jgi:hypothetical protein